MTTAPLRALFAALVAAVVTVAAAPAAHAQADEPQPEAEAEAEPEADPGRKIGENAMFGLGLGSGTYVSGVTGKLYLGERAAVQAFVGDLSSLDRYGFDCVFGCGVGVSADYIIEFYDIVDSAGNGRLFLGAGGGGYIGALALEEVDAVALGVNGVFQIGWHFYQFPLELIVDIRPLISLGDFAPDIFNFDGGFAVRYFF